MCLAVAQPVGVRLARERLNHGWDTNPDGGGYAFLNDDNEIVIRKFMEWQPFITQYNRDVARFTRSPFIVHERLGTHGNKDTSNVHPFVMDEHTVVAHNGIIRCLMYKDDRSDTRTFVEDYLSKLPPTWFDDPQLFDLVKDYIGMGNKLVLLTNHPDAEKNLYVVGESRGHWDKGAWWSNKSYEPYRTSTGWTYNKGSSRGAGATTIHATGHYGRSQAGSSARPPTPTQTVKAGADTGGGSDPKVRATPRPPLATAGPHEDSLRAREDYRSWWQKMMGRHLPI